MEFCKVTLTFECVDEILWCDHSNESSLPVLSHDAIFSSKILENEIWKFGRNLPWPHLVVKGLNNWSIESNLSSTTSFWERVTSLLKKVTIVIIIFSPGPSEITVSKANKIWEAQREAVGAGCSFFDSYNHWQKFLLICLKVALLWTISCCKSYNFKFQLLLGIGHLH